MNFQSTFFAILPPIITIILGLVTKKVNLSLIIGIVLGVLLYSKFDILLSFYNFFELLIKQIGSNLGIVIFLVLLGIFVYLINVSGASKAYANWARVKLNSKRKSLLATFFLGIIIFVDDYFNCLTVGSVMSPVTDKFKVSREKLAYVIDTTAAPICMIMPVSSWAAAVSSSLPSDSNLNGFSLFVKAIPANFYSILSLVMVFLIIVLNFDFGKMKEYEKNVDVKDDSVQLQTNGKVKDLIIPVLVLIISCIFFMLYTGGIFNGNSLIEAFMNCDAIISLCIGSFISVIFLMCFYIFRKVISFKEFSNSLQEGFKNMIPSILILCFAWALGGICSGEYLNAGGFISNLVDKFNVPLIILPMFIFLISALLSFSTGTSWATFAILIPMVVSVFNDTESNLLIITIAAILGGSVCGDHLSPISDTTILSSTGANCPHLNHVKTQAVYGFVCLVCSFIGYIISGISQNIYLGLFISLIILIIFIFIMYYLNRGIKNDRRKRI